LERRVRYTALIGIVFVVNYFLYINMVRQESLHLEHLNGFFLFIIISVWVDILAFIVYISMKQREKIESLSKYLEDKDKKIEQLYIEFKQKVKKQIETSKAKDKMIYEQSKLMSMRELLRNISHQWRQPLSIISVAVTTIQFEEENGLKSKKERILNTCKLVNENVQYLSKTLDNFDEFSKQKRKQSVFRLGHLIQALLDLTAIFSDTFNINIEYKIKKDISVYSYKPDLIQALLNILYNSKEIFEQRAIKEKYIFIKVDSDEKFFTIDIKDTAGGIDEDKIDRVFEPYFTTKHQSQGVGLGLYLTYVIVTQRLKGDITVRNTTFVHEESGKEYRCAEFLITVPIIE